MDLLMAIAWRAVIVFIFIVGTILNVYFVSAKGKVGGFKTIIKIIIVEVLLIYICYSFSELGYKSSIGIVAVFKDKLMPLISAAGNYIMGNGN